MMSALKKAPRLAPWKPKDFVALVLVSGYVVYVMYSGNTMIPATIMLIVGYYFARRDEPDHNGNHDGK